MEFKDLVGKNCYFYGVDCNEFRLEYGKHVYTFEAIENENDGYRSYLGSIEIVDSKSIFFRTPIANVIIQANDNIEGWQFIDVSNGHVWLLIGTNYDDEYYPLFTFEYTPDPNDPIFPV